MPKVSIIMPSYNGQLYINKAIKSVLKQSFNDWELLVVDDGSEEPLADYIKEVYLSDKRIKLIENEKNLGLQRTLNKGLSLASGKYIARLDDDDWWGDQLKLSLQVDLLDTNPTIGICGTGVVVLDEGDNEIFRYKAGLRDKDIRNNFLKKNPYAHSSVLFRADLAREQDGYSEDNSELHIEDYDLWARIGLDSQFGSIDCYCTNFLLKDDSISSLNKKDQLRKNINLINKYKSSYPRGFIYLCFAWLRYLGFSIYTFLPESLKRRVFSLYKKS